MRDFLFKEKGLSDLWSEFNNNFPNLSHERLKQCCYNYIKINISEHLPFKTLLPTVSSAEAANLRRLISEKFPFLKYAVRNVLYHTDIIEGGGIS